MEKIYVDVIVKIDKNGEKRPMFILWKDGLKYEVTHVKERVRAASLKVGGCGIRYKLMVNGKEVYLFEQEDKWFVEGKHR